MMFTLIYNDAASRTVTSCGRARRSRLFFSAGVWAILSGMPSNRPATMRAMLLETPGQPLRATEIPTPVPGPAEVLIRVGACGVCRTDLHVRDGELRHPKLPLVLGHEVVGVVVDRGEQVEHLSTGERVGVPWLGGTCGQCAYCRTGRENLCARAVFTGYQRDGGYAEYTVADARYCFRVPDGFGDAEAAPLLCAGLIGYRALRKAGDAARIGLYGFGAAAHIVAQVARWEGRRVFAFTRPGDRPAQAFARQRGAEWAGASDDDPPEPLDAAILFAPVGSLVPLALGHVDRGGTVVCAGIHMSDIPSFPYESLWGERTICSVANLTRADGEALLAIAPRVPIATDVVRFPLAAADEALDGLRHGRFQGAAVVVP
jgi:alcohol dehydrogenase, propanol-preferring